MWWVVNNKKIDRHNITFKHKKNYGMIIRDNSIKEFGKLDSEFYDKNR